VLGVGQSTKERGQSIIKPIIVQFPLLKKNIESIHDCTEHFDIEVRPEIVSNVLKIVILFSPHMQLPCAFTDKSTLFGILLL
jgi:hypothetical protein